MQRLEIKFRKFCKQPSWQYWAGGMAESLFYIALHAKEEKGKKKDVSLPIFCG